MSDFADSRILSQRVRWDEWSSARNNYVTSAEDCGTSMSLLARSTKLKMQKLWEVALTLHADIDKERLVRRTTRRVRVV